MKKLSLVVIAELVSITLSFAQTNILNSTGSVGVGTTSPESGFIFDVNGLATIGTQTSARLYLGTLDATHAFIQSRNYSINQDLTFLAKSFNFNIGNVGIGTSTPTAKLEITGGPIWTSNGWLKSVKLQSGAAIQLSAANAKFGFGATDNDGLFFFSSPTDDASQSASYIMSMRANGNVGIGSLNPGEKLSVNGKIRAHEIKVEMSGWSDFVFAKDYLLPTLQETETHIKEKGHLPGIPSAAEVEKNGIELGEMNKKLLQKIEELTLYLIEQNKSISRLQTQNENLTSEMDKIKSKL